MENHKCCVCENKKLTKKTGGFWICKKCDRENFEVDINAKMIKKHIVMVGG